ncbi:MAG: polyketide synthase, partial [Hyphomicrobiales bacterium]|nr:polyketide synthase [Hyphomicrobiales bacterium]
WRNLAVGRDCITEIPPERWDWREFYGDPAQEANKTNIKWGGFIEGIDEFDPLFFGISPREARLMDPQQRLLMLYVWKAIEDAGYSAHSLWGSNTGIFVGTASSGYSELIARANIGIEGYSATGMVPSVGPNRMSYFLNLHGPSEPVETACSSSLIAIHRAMTAIETDSCEMAIVGGVNTILTPATHISFNKAGMLCEDGRCKTFSAQANGYVRGEGVGMLFLKTLNAAQQAGDHIYAVIRGSAENHGGRANSLTSPNPTAQAELLKTAYTQAGIDARTVSYIEAHGTGTALGDPIEINGLKAAFKALYEEAGNPHGDRAHCGLGSVKSNIGHLELAAGIAGVIKVVLQLQHNTLVKSLHCDDINPYIQLENTP